VEEMGENYRKRTKEMLEGKGVMKMGRKECNPNDTLTP
jgi:hypothetical protein